jgi:hypothetical protein
MRSMPANRRRLLGLDQRRRGLAAHYPAGRLWHCAGALSTHLRGGERLGVDVP